MSSKKSSSSKHSRSKKSGAGSKNNNTLWLIIGLMVIIAISITAFVLLQQDNPSPVASAGEYPQEISVDEAAAKREQGAFILDVRQPEEWQEYHIPGSTLIPLGDLPNRINEVPGNQEVVVVCRSGNRSQSGRDILRNAGYSTVTSMNGGLNQWKDSGYETVSGP